MQNAAAVDALVADLVGGEQSSPAVVGPPASRRVLAVMCSSRYNGEWVVPERLDVAAVMSEVRIDLRLAVLPPVCTIHISATMANVAIIVPPGMAVQFDVGAFMGASRSDARPRGLNTGGPLVTVTGFAFMAEVRVRVR
jgi:Predicted membrane protein